VLLACLLLLLAAFAVSAASTGVVWRVSRRLGVGDTAPVAGQIKEPTRGVPNTGGIGLFLGVAVPLLAGLIVVFITDPETSAGGVFSAVGDHAAGAREKAGLALALLASLAALHVLGVVDDRRPLGPIVKLLVMTAPCALFPVLTDTRLLTAIDPYVGGPWLSVLVTTVWMLGVTNALNLIDNMDGACAGVAAIAGACFAAAALVSGQWFVAATLALLVGSCLGFLVWNVPPAKVFLGDGGSLVIGFLLAFLTVRTTYAGESPTGEPLAGGWYAVFMPVLVLAVPLYDTVSVTLIRIRQGRSPMVGDLQHLSHRLVKRGLSKRAAVVVMWGLTGASGIGGIVLGHLRPWQAVLVGVQAALIVLVVALLEWKSSPAGARHDSLDVTPPGRSNG
jgi:UDP-GlcNAc:undecaprenyl-phosphate GlcNAc-1-phosphate transferase